MNEELYLVLHGLAIKKYASPEAVAGLLGLEPARVAALLAESVSRGRVLQSQDRYTLAPMTRVTLDGMYSRFCAELRGNPGFVRGYEDFERINGSLKALITDWQVLTIGGARVANDHSDADYDRRIIDRLGDLHEGAESLLGHMAVHLPRLAIYANKLQAALEKAEDGAIEWVSDARIESYHTLWFELHEDLLRLLGRVRVE
jgi:hypothetical protein